MDTPLTNPNLAPAPVPSQTNGNHSFELDPAVVPDVNKLVTVDETPVDSILAEKLQRLLTHPLYASWHPPGEGRCFLVLANVGYFYAYRKQPLVPDVLLSLDVASAGPLETKEGHSYFQWLMEKPPDVIIEIVSDKRGGEEGHKMKTYARQRVPYYAIHDPDNLLQGGELRVYHLEEGYVQIDPAWLPGVGLGLTLWEGTFEGVCRKWLRWCDRDGIVIPTGEERAQFAEDSAKLESHRANVAESRAEQLSKKLQQLEAKLRDLGVEPEI
jgi:Uma2 family endonuclease